MNFIIIILLVMFGALLVGFMFMWLGFMFYDFLYARSLKKKIPKDKKLMLDGGKPIIDKEVEAENDIRNIGESRDWERIRRIAIGRIKEQVGNNKPSNGEPERSSVPYEPVIDSPPIDDRTPKPKRPSSIDW